MMYKDSVVVIIKNELFYDNEHMISKNDQQKYFIRRMKLC